MTTTKFLVYEDVLDSKNGIVEDDWYAWHDCKPKAICGTLEEAREIYNTIDCYIAKRRPTFYEHYVRYIEEIEVDEEGELVSSGWYCDMEGFEIEEEEDEE